MQVKGKNLAAAFRPKRVELRLSQKKLAATLGLNVQVISNVERGVQSLNSKHVIKISKILAIPLETLKRAMVKDYEDALHSDINLALDRASLPGKLREGSPVREVLQVQGIYDYSMPSGSR